MKILGQSIVALILLGFLSILFMFESKDIETSTSILDFVITPAPTLSTISDATGMVTPKSTSTTSPALTPIPTPENASACKEKGRIIGGVISGTLGVERGFKNVYCVEEDLLIPSGASLTLYEGTILVFAPGTGMTVAGQLIGQGNEVFPVELISVVETGWNGIHFLPSAQLSKCHGCYLQNLAIGSTALEVEAPVIFEHGLIRDVPAGTAISSTASITLSNVLIDYVDTGLYFSGQTITNESIITHLTLSRCEKGVVNHGQKVTIMNSILAYCILDVSTLSGVTDVSYSLFYKFQHDFLTEPNAQLIRGPGLLDQDPAFVDFPDDFRLEADSPAVNAANPASDYSYEVGFNGRRADLGRYGNTRQATERIPYEQMSFTLSVNETVLSGLPGETLSYTLRLTNTGLFTDTYFILGKMSQSRAFDLDGLEYTYDTDSYSGIFADVIPQESRIRELEITIPDYAANGIVNYTTLRTSGSYTGEASIELTTVVSVPTSIQKVGHIGGIDSLEMSVQGSFVYIAAGQDGLRIVDMLQPQNPAEVGYYLPSDTISGYVQDVVVSGKYAYLATARSGIEVINISNPAKPFKVGGYEQAGLAKKLAFRDNTLYVLWDECSYYPYCPDDSLRIIDTSDLASFTEIAAFHSPGRIQDLEIVDNCLYLAVGSGFRVLDITNPNNPIEVGLFDQENTFYQNAQKLFSYGQSIYIADGEVGLRIVDISDPTNPLEIGTYKKGYVSNVVVIDNYAYITDNRQEELRVLDISNPENIQEVDLYSYDTELNDLASIANYLYSGTYVWDISNPLELRLVDKHVPVNVQDVAVTGKYAYIADAQNGLYVFDIYNPDNPAWVSLYDQYGGVWEVEITGSYAYVVSSVCDTNYDGTRAIGCKDSALRILDISNPLNIHQIKEYDTLANQERFLNQLRIWGKRLYYVDRLEAQLHILDITQPDTPSVIDPLESSVARFQIANDYLYTLSPTNFTYIQGGGGYTSTTTFEILDINTLRKVGSYQLSEKTPGVNMVVIGTLAFVYWDVPCLSGCVFDGWLTLDISDPTNPVLVDIPYKLLPPHDSFSNENYIYLAMGSAGMNVWDISEPSTPKHVDAFDESGYALSVTEDKNYIYLSSGLDGVFILRQRE